MSWWHSLSETTRTVIKNTLMGLTIMLVMHYYSNSNWLSSKQDPAIDFVMSMTANTASEATVPFSFIDIDSDTFLKWGEPIQTPRDKLATLISYAIASDPMSLTVDIDLSRPGDTGDEALLDALQSTDNSFPILLMKTFREELPGSNRSYREQRLGAFEQLVEDNPNIHWASPLYSRDGDFVVRRWRMWEQTCRDGSPEILPSVQLMLFAQQTEGTTEALSEQLAGHLPDRCDQWPDQQLNELTVGGLTFDTQEKLAQRIIYHLPWQSLSEEPYPMIATAGDERTSLLKVVSAQTITEAQQPPATGLLAGHHIIIGGSHWDGGDVHATPLGYLPGSLVVVNAVHSLTTEGLITKPALWLTLLIQAMLLIAMSYTFTRLGSGYGKLLCTLFVCIVIVPVSFFIFKEGIWLDFVVPLFVVTMHRSLDKTEKLVSDLRQMVIGE